MQTLRTVFMGTPDFSVPCLELLAHHPHIDLVQVVSRVDQKQGRGMQLHSPPVAAYAKEKKIPLTQTESINSFDRSSWGDIDLIVVIAFGQFLNDEILNSPKIGCFNIHTSLLPKYRGAAPIQHAVLNGDQETGVSIQKMVKKMDAGDLALERKITLAPSEDTPQLYHRLKFQAALALNDLIGEVLENRVEFRAQDESAVSFAPTIKKEDGHIQLGNMSADRIMCMMRAYRPWPGVFLKTTEGKILKVHQASITQKNLAPGEIEISGGNFIVGCKEGSLSLEVVQLQGKSKIDAQAFINGSAKSIRFEV